MRGVNTVKLSKVKINIILSITYRLDRIVKLICSFCQTWEVRQFDNLTALSLTPPKNHTNQTRLSALLMLPIKGHRPLDVKSIAHYVKILDIKGDTMTMKMEVSTFLTEKR